MAEYKKIKTKKINIKKWLFRLDNNININKDGNYNSIFNKCDWTQHTSFIKQYIAYKCNIMDIIDFKRLHNTLQIDNKKCIDECKYCLNGNIKIMKNYLTPKQTKQIKTKIVKKYKFEEKMNKMNYKDDNKIIKAKIHFKQCLECEIDTTNRQSKYNLFPCNKCKNLYHLYELIHELDKQNSIAPFYTNFKCYNCLDDKLIIKFNLIDMEEYMDYYICMVLYNKQILLLCKINQKKYIKVTFKHVIYLFEHALWIRNAKKCLYDYDMNKNSVKYFFKSFNTLRRYNTFILNYNVDIYKLFTKEYSYSCVIHIKKKNNNELYRLFNNNNNNNLNKWIQYAFTNNWNELKKKYPNFIIDKKYYKELCINYSHKGFLKCNKLYKKNISIKDGIFNIIKYNSLELSNIINGVYKLHGYKKLKFIFESWSIMKTIYGYNKTQHNDAPGYLPIIGLHYLKLNLKDGKEKQLGFEAILDRANIIINPSMSIKVEEGDYLIFTGFFADKLQHAPIGGTKQQLVTYRAPTKKVFYCKK